MTMTRATRAGLLKFALVNGAADSSTVGVTTAAQDGTAITENDILIGVMELAATTNAWTDVTASSAIIAGGKVTFPASAGDVVAILWLARDAGLQVASPFVASEVGAGGLGDTDITIAGIATGDSLVAVIEINATSGAWANRTGNSSITAANTIQCSDSTDGNSVYVIYMDKTGPRGFSALNLHFGIATIDASPTDFPSSATLTGINAEDVILSAMAVDETDYDILDDLTSVTLVSADDTLVINEPSPTAVASSKMFCLYQKSNDLDS